MFTKKTNDAKVMKNQTSISQKDKKMSRKEIRKKEQEIKKKAFDSQMNNQRYTSEKRTVSGKKKKVKNPMLKPRTTNEVVQCFFKDFDKKTNIFKIADSKYSVCYEYKDINFSKTDGDEVLNVLVKWRDYLNSLNENVSCHIVDANTPVKTQEFKEKYSMDVSDKFNPIESQLCEEFNDMIYKTIGDSEVTLTTRRYLVLTLEGEDYKQVSKQLVDLEHSAMTKFKEFGSSISIVTWKQRLKILYETLNLNAVSDEEFDKILEQVGSKKDEADQAYTIYDALAPKYFNMREDDLIEIHDSNNPGSPQKFIRTLYVADLPSSMTPRFYNRITTIEDVMSIITLNIQPLNNGKFLKKVNQQITGMKSERLSKVKKAQKNGYDYSIVMDEALEDKLDKAQELRTDLTKNKQKIFDMNMMITLIANSYEDLTNATLKILEISGEQLVDVKQLMFMQLEGLLHSLPFGHNELMINRTLTSDALALNVPFNSKDLLQPSGLFFGQNLVSKRGTWADRRKLMNGNGCVLATSGAGKSFNVKTQIEQILLKYPEDEVVIIDPQGEYDPLLQAFDGQKIKISTNSKTYINPFDTDMNYGFGDGGADPVREKTEYLIAFCESLTGAGTLDGIEKTIIDRCTRIVFEDYQNSHFSDKSFAPDLKMFHECLKMQPEIEAQQLALTLERYVNGSMDLFAHETNVQIKNRFVCFDISDLPTSIQNTGYLVILDHIMNRLAHNAVLKKCTWLYIDEFHILLKNPYSAEYVAKIYKTGRKLNALNTVVTQNISEVLENPQGRKILSNSEFACLFKQKPLDLKAIQEIFNIPNEMASYLQDPPFGQGIMVFGEDKLPFNLFVPDNTEIYKLNNTKNMNIRDL